MRGRFRRLRRLRERGQTLVEFTLVTPILFTILFGVIESALMFSAWVSVQHAASESARFAVTGRSSCPSGGVSRTSCIQTEARDAIQHLHNGETSLVSYRSWAWPTYSAVTENDPGKHCDAVEVKVEYQYVPRTPLIGAIFGTKTLVGRQRYVNEPWGICGQVSYNVLPAGAPAAALPHEA